MATRVISIATGADDAEYYNGTFNNTRNYVNLGSHTVDTIGPWVGLRFALPTDIDPSTITDARIRIRSANTGSFNCYVRVEQAHAPVWADTVSDRPRERFNAVGSTGEVLWSGTSTVIGESFNSPDISARLKTAMQNLSSGNYIGVLCGINFAAASIQIMQTASFEHTGIVEPQLVITYAASPNYDAIEETNTSYHDGIGLDTNQFCDISVPAGVPPNPAGRPCVVWLHGGFWKTGVGTRNDIPAGFKDYVVNKGYAFVNASYKLVQENILSSNTGRSFPDPVLDIKTLANYLTANSDRYRIDPSRLILAGNSAGGHIALWTALTNGDTSNYTGYQNANNNRSSTPGNTRPTFDLDKNITSTAFMGVFVWVAPIDIYQITQHPDGVQATANHAGRTGYMGGVQNTNPAQSWDELDLHRYIAGSGNTYGTTKHEPTIPIGYIRATNDEIVLEAAGISPLHTALGSTGFTYDRPAVGTITATGLSRFEISTTHSAAMSNTTTWDYFSDWLDVVVGDDAASSSTWVPKIIEMP